MKIEILGSGCPKCRAAEQHARKALAELGLEAELAHVYDVKEFARRGVMFTPAVAIDGQVRVAGHVPGVKELKALFEAAKPDP
jgi:small redox-active disulfide protein 2